MSQAADPAQRGKAKAVLIAGPTASGKSALALALAERFGGVVINADSMQVYRDLQVITARPGPGDMAGVPHRLYGTVDGAVNFSVARWLQAALAEIAAAEAEGLLPILIGGTGLYFKALTQGISDIPPVPDEVRQTLRAEAEGLAAPALHARLAALDPVTAARLRPNDPQRTLRALEVFIATGRPLAHWQEDGRSAPALPVGQCVAAFLTVERSVLRQRIDDRFVAMMTTGALDEVAALASRRLDPALPVMRAHGVPGLIAHLGGEMSLADAIARGQKDTRAYAKRQETWFRHQMAGFVALAPDTALAALTTALQD
ncbi:tRNA (adenosine(37)-N6)-dimethylallyltransferase MiaA [Phreatobacter stygius]|uniref:tRNA (adenosine(37)-N6)-dimethylallyltransferase MiaA n=1 Tax=Phreatobacter stygius TaxID=1940610 RepID=UPI001476F8F3|nr:tRNA (adenosine(37)-N6)-dimethylallyltransferase MiaA [Phreatobacter stygius]